nr:uncharacterized protein LOC122271820 [Parasteatoda tepidariorum]
MKVSPTLVFDKKSLEIHGFTDLGDYTPSSQTSQKGDHALVLMFQPFRGKWVQTIACFLSKNAASGTVLHHLIIEAVTLMEKSGFFVDAVVCDGATWNRSMFKKFGISLDSVSCEHITDPTRRLWFISDFPHLIKNLRNAIVSNQVTFVSFICLVLFYILMCRRIYYIVLNFSFFSASTAAALQVYSGKVPELKESSGCANFVRRINTVVDAMNSRTPLTALKLNSLPYKEIQDFLIYLIEWEALAKSKGWKFMSESTYFGLRVTCQATLELAEFLSSKCDFKYLMTARLNQDSLEVFSSFIL